MQNPKLFFSSLATALLLASSYGLEAKAESNDNWLSQVRGSYSGKIWSGGALVPVETEFIMNNDTSLIGSYSIKEQGLGVLSRCQAVKTFVVRCFWDDRYGSGDYEVTFTKDFSGFKGYWSPKGLTEKLPWDGTRQGS